ncbi:MAG: ORF6N domain-containing protein [Limisphaerales bacterium]
MPKQTRPVPFAAIESRIHLIRETKVMLDADLAELYGVATKNLNKAVERNRERFPEDFMFQLSLREFAGLRFRFGTSKSRGGRRYLPYAFTQEGIAMLSSVLRSPRAVAVNVEIMRAFVRMRRMLLSVDELARKVEALERKAVAHDQDLEAVFKALKQLIAPREAPRREIGFHVQPTDSAPESGSRRPSPETAGRPARRPTRRSTR